MNKHPRYALRPMLLVGAGLLPATGLTQTAEQTLPAVRVEAAQDPADVHLQGTRTHLTVQPTGLPAGITVVTPAQIETLNIGRDISGVFRRVPGVVANNIDQGDTGNGFRMRGFATQGTHGADTAVYVDGVPQNMPSSQAGAGHGPAYLEWVVPGMIDRISVIKGPVSALHGDQNRAGAVSIESPVREVPSSVSLSLERYGGRRASLVLSRPLGRAGDVQSLLVADVYRTGSFRRDARSERDNLFWKLTTQVGDGLYSLRVNHYRSDFTAAGYLLLPDLQAGTVEPRSSQFGNPGFGSGRRSAIVLNRAPVAGEEGWHAALYAETFERLRATASSDVQHTVGSDDRHFFGGRVFRNFVAGDRAALTLGTELRRDKGDAVRRIWRDHAPTPSYVNSQSLDLLTYGLFAQAQYKPVSSLKLLAGVRRDWFDYDIENRKLPAASTEYKAGVTTPKLGAVWSVGPRLDLYANVAEGFRSPAAEQISSSGPVGPLGSPGGTIFSVTPTKVRSYDLGFTATPAAGWTAGLVLYQIENEDEIVSQADGSFRSAGATTRKGYEIETRWQATRSLAMYASYGRILEAKADNPLPTAGARISIPRHVVKAGVEHRARLGEGRLVLNADGYVSSGTPYYAGSPQTELRLMPTYTRFDLRASYEWDRYQLAAFAVFQPHAYAADIAYGSPAGLLIAPQPQRQFGVSLRYFF